MDNGKIEILPPTSSIPDEEVILWAQQEIKGELQLPCDAYEPLKRRVLMGIHTYGINTRNALQQIAAFTGLSVTTITKLIAEKDSNWIGPALKEDIIPCFTKPEIISRLCIEAEYAQSSKDRINALSKIMEFRGMTSPEGASKSFQRIAMRFKTS